ncbi:phage baseplate protein [Zobellella denitrificans]|uniref:Phage baseplate protein n=1 Tax=Zobellella denitrificans TaxID=347534 RepID=A0A291HQK5_9GAMM|nr:phage baseplate assembly protein V [Zobellella denitrificans]ATG74323.1 phage baseplate protein [Zobellella denitrificans]ATG74447.1 phage baseplate protein [Zobellella denitrificans]
MSERVLNRVLGPLQRRLRLMVSRAVVRLVDDAFARQNLQLSLLAGEGADGVERFQNYGHSSVPLAGAEAVVVAVGGKRQHLVALAVEHKGHRPTGLEAGDSVLYHHEGHMLRLTKEGVAILSCRRFEVQAEQEVFFDTPQTRFGGDVEILGVSAAADHVSDGVSGKNHTHDQVQPGDGSSGGPQ